MQANSNNTRAWATIALIAVLILPMFGRAQQVEIRQAAVKSSQLTFDTPTAAGAALLKAAKNGDENSLGRILGLDTRSLLPAGDTEQGKAALEAFAAKYERMNRWLEMSDGSRVLYIGADNFAFPVPLAQNASGRWYFDGVAGAGEVRARNIGRNEMLAIDDCSAIADAEGLYFIIHGDSPQFTQRIVSTQGQQDGLYWPASALRGPSPLGALAQLPKSSLPSLSPDQPLVIDGYVIRILTAQGNDAPGGARSYVVNGKMTGGFAVLATPVQYAETGVMTFMVGADGSVYEQDLGPDTAKIAASMQEFNPSEDWSSAEGESSFASASVSFQAAGAQ